MNQQELNGIARALLLAGGVVAIALGGLELLGAAIRLSGLGAIRPIFGVVVGVLALATMNQVKSEAIQLVLIVLGLISGNAGGYLITLAGIIGLVAKYSFGAGAQPSPSAPTTAT